jgi:hypothetical protein
MEDKTYYAWSVMQMSYEMLSENFEVKYVKGGGFINATEQKTETLPY